MIPYAIKRQVINDTSIVEVVSEYVQLKKKGTSMFGLCPFHNDNNPSMSVSDKVKMFNCFSCSAKGNVINFVARYENISEDMATIKLAKRLGIEINANQTKAEIEKERLMKVMGDANEFYEFYLQNSDEGINALEYLRNRGIDETIIKEFSIGLSSSETNFLNLALTKKNDQVLDQLNLGLVKENEAGKYYDVFRNRIMFPIKDKFGKIVGFSGRIYTDSNQAKYINSVENAIFHKGEILYNYHNAMQNIRKLDKVYLFEGFMDVIAANRAGITNGVATMGTALTNEHINMLLSLTKNIVLCFDGDDAGIKAMKRSTLLLSKLNLIPNAVVLPDSLDPDEFLAKYGKDKLVDYLETKQKNVYYCLYDLAYEKMIPNDLVSVETFKNEVFNFLRTTNQETIHNFFFKKLAGDIGISLEKIIEDFGQLPKQAEVSEESSNYHNYDSLNNLPTNTENPVISRKKEVRISKKVRLAYETILKHSIYSKDRFAIFFEKSYYGSIIRYPGKELVNEYLILLELQNFYNDHELLGIENLTTILGAQPELLATAMSIINNHFIDITQKHNFEECLQTIIDFYKHCDQIQAYNQLVSSGDLKNCDEFIKVRSDNVRIIKKENKI